MPQRSTSLSPWTTSWWFHRSSDGVAPAVISVICLPKLSRADASELFLNGERIPASRAAEVGLINHSVPENV